MAVSPSTTWPKPFAGIQGRRFATNPAVEYLRCQILDWPIQEAMGDGRIAVDDMAKALGLHSVSAKFATKPPMEYLRYQILDWPIHEGMGDRDATMCDMVKVRGLHLDVCYEDEDILLFPSPDIALEQWRFYIVAS